MTASASDRVKGIVRKAKDMVGLGEKGTTTEKIKDTINRTADKAKGAVDEVSEVVSEGKDKAKEVAAGSVPGIGDRLLFTRPEPDSRRLVVL